MLNFVLSLRNFQCSSFMPIIQYFIQGLKLVFECTKERDELCVCIDKWLGNPEFKKGVIQEYLDERSYFRYNF